MRGLVVVKQYFPVRRQPGFASAKKFHLLPFVSFDSSLVTKLVVDIFFCV